MALCGFPAEFSLGDSVLGKGTLFCGLIHTSNTFVGWSQQRPVFNAGLRGFGIRASLNWHVSQPVPGHLCIVRRVLQGVVPSRGAMAVELGFLSGHTTSLDSVGHLSLSPQPSPQMDAGVGGGFSALFLSPEHPGHLRYGTGWAVGQGHVWGFSEVGDRF